MQKRLPWSLVTPPFLFASSKLVINQIIPEDDAIYQCMAENSQGSILAQARLTVVLSEDRPSAPCNVHAETMSSSAILLAWERPLYNSDKVIAYSVHYMKAEGKLLLPSGQRPAVEGGSRLFPRMLHSAFPTCPLWRPFKKDPSFIRNACPNLQSLRCPCWVGGPAWSWRGWALCPPLQQTEWPVPQDG